MEAQPKWKLHIYGFSHQYGSGPGPILVTLEGYNLDLALHLNFKILNNEVAYEALIVGLDFEIALVAK